jgi:4a-hydroxytetrahydrobiopterin dehydratase
MSERKALTPQEVESALQSLPGWVVVHGAGAARELHKRFVFTDFAHAIAFMTAVAGPIDVLNHHPRWENVWNRIDVYLSTHDLGSQISARDVELAKLLELHFANAAGKA